jgi:hypothetical protein
LAVEKISKVEEVKKSIHPSIQQGIISSWVDELCCAMRHQPPVYFVCPTHRNSFSKWSSICTHIQVVCLALLSL